MTDLEKNEVQEVHEVQERNFGTTTQLPVQPMPVVKVAGDVDEEAVEKIRAFFTKKDEEKVNTIAEKVAEELNGSLPKELTEEDIYQILANFKEKVKTGSYAAGETPSAVALKLANEIESALLKLADSKSFELRKGSMDKFYVKTPSFINGTPIPEKFQQVNDLKETSDETSNRPYYDPEVFGSFVKEIKESIGQKDKLEQIRQRIGNTNIPLEQKHRLEGLIFRSRLVDSIQLGVRSNEKKSQIPPVEFLVRAGFTPEEAKEKIDSGRRFQQIENELQDTASDTLPKDKTPGVKVGKSNIKTTASLEDEFKKAVDVFEQKYANQLPSRAREAFLSDYRKIKHGGKRSSGNYSSKSGVTDVEIMASLLLPPKHVNHVSNKQPKVEVSPPTPDVIQVEKPKPIPLINRARLFVARKLLVLSKKLTKNLETI